MLQLTFLPGHPSLVKEYDLKTEDHSLYANQLSLVSDTDVLHDVSVSTFSDCPANKTASG